MIHFDAANLHYEGPNHAPVQALSNFSLDIAQNEVLVVIGPSGCGKTSMLRCINGLTRITSGHLEVAGMDLSPQCPIPPKLRRIVGLVFQQYNLFPHLSVLDNITLAPIHVLGQAPGEAKEAAMALLEQVNLSDKADVTPNRLSGGQQQRVAILRSLAMRPEILLLDEPTSALDPDMTWEVLELIRSVARQGITMVIVTHELSFARTVADRIVLMREGRVEESGSPQNLFQNPANDFTCQYLERLLHQQSLA